jgi:hypothetical protein
VFQAGEISSCGRRNQNVLRTFLLRNVAQEQELLRRNSICIVLRTALLDALMIMVLMVWLDHEMAWCFVKTATFDYPKRFEISAHHSFTQIPSLIHVFCYFECKWLFSNKFAKDLMIDCQTFEVFDLIFGGKTASKFLIGQMFLRSFLLLYCVRQCVGSSP